MSATQTLHTSLLRPPILHILRAAGFHTSRPSVVDTVVDLAARYLLLLASTTAAHANNNHNDIYPDITDVRMALQDCGLFRPQLTAVDEDWGDEEDLRGVEAFLDWARGEPNRAIRRIAGLVGDDAQNEVDELGEREDFLTALKKKHSKTGEESRFQGTALGKQAEDKEIKIEGAPVDSIRAWEAQLRHRQRNRQSLSMERTSSSELSQYEGDMDEA
ncbi:MAG: hypothetical protein M1819_004929 [Sarea resinae]|nr:MAG: hypothetical protein M1819_004929 [Sarea resinae]